MVEIERVRVRQQRSVRLVRELRARPCSDCSGTFEPHQMDFDHRPGTVKLFRLTSGASMLRSASALRDEAAKCDVVCANCHRIRTWKRQLAIGMPTNGSSRYIDRKRKNWRVQARMLERLRAAPCMDCGLRFPPCAMDFDHRDPGSKRAAVSRLIGRAGTTRILDEVAACDIVCANCHRLRTFRRRSPMQCGSSSAVEWLPSKQHVAGSNPVSRSITLASCRGGTR
jgi:hypothetical protein